MAKSIRSKRKRKLRAERREKLKPRLKERLEKVLGVNGKETSMELEVNDSKELEGGPATQHVPQGEVVVGSIGNENTAEDAGDVVMKSEDSGQKKLSKKALKRISKRKGLKRLGSKKKKGQKMLKW